MSHHRLTPSVHRQENQLAEALSALRTTLELPGPFPEDVLREAKEAVANHRLPELDFTHIEFVTIDPASSTDLVAEGSFTQASALSGASEVASANLLDDRTAAISRDSRRDALQDAANADLLQQAEAQVKQRNAP